jgi:hypothetical protein
VSVLALMSQVAQHFVHPLHMPSLIETCRYERLLLAIRLAALIPIGACVSLSDATVAGALKMVRNICSLVWKVAEKDAAQKEPIL